MPHAFGDGPHKCIGMHLAKLEVKIVLEEFAKRVEAFSITDESKISAQITKDSFKYLKNPNPAKFKSSSMKTKKIFELANMISLCIKLCVVLFSLTHDLGLNFNTNARSGA